MCEPHLIVTRYLIVCCWFCLLLRRPTIVVRTNRIHKIIRFTCARCTIVFIHLARCYYYYHYQHRTFTENTLRSTISHMFQARARAYNIFSAMHQNTHLMRPSKVFAHSQRVGCSSRVANEKEPVRHTSEQHIALNETETRMKHSINLDTFVTFCFYLFIESMVRLWLCI